MSITNEIVIGYAPGLEFAPGFGFVQAFDPAAVKEESPMKRYQVISERLQESDNKAREFNEQFNGRTEADKMYERLVAIMSVDPQMKFWKICLQEADAPPFEIEHNIRFDEWESKENHNGKS